MGKTWTEQCEESRMMVENYFLFPVILTVVKVWGVGFVSIVHFCLVLWFWFWCGEFFFIDVSEVCADCVMNVDFDDNS